MDRVFVSKKDSPKKGLFKNIIGGSGKSKRRPSDVPTEYFPYAGGDGVDGYEFNPVHLGYDPAETMIDSHVNIEEDDSLQRNIKRVLLRNSKYEVHTTLPPPSKEEPASSSGALINESALPETPPANARHASSGAPSIGIDIPENLWTLQWLNDINFEQAVALVRQASRYSVVLYPIDILADKIEGLETPVAGLEVFLMMLMADQLANLVQLLCRPAVMVAKLILKFF